MSLGAGTRRGSAHGRSCLAIQPIGPGGEPNPTAKRWRAAREGSPEARLSYAAPTTVEELWRGITGPVMVSLVLVYAVVAALGWWRPVFVDHKPVRRWVRVLAVIMVVSLAAASTPRPG